MTEPEPIVRMPAQDVQFHDYIRRGVPAHFRRVKEVRLRPRDVAEVIYDDGEKVSFGSVEIVEVVRSGPSAPPGSIWAVGLG